MFVLCFFSLPFFSLSVKVTAGWDLTCAVLNGEVGCFGSGRLGGIGRGDTENWGAQPGQMGNLVPITLPGPTLKVDQVAAGLSGNDHTCLLFTNKRAVCFGYNPYGECGAGTTTSPLLGPVSSLAFLNAAASPVRQVVPLQGATCVLSDADSSVTCWGYGGYGTLGRGDAASPASLGASSPVVFDQPTVTVTMISGANLHVCALFSNRRVRCWGDNQYGELGQGHSRAVGLAASDMTSLLFVSFSDATAEVAQVSAGTGHSCALLSSPAAGRIVCWGQGSHGQLGTGSVFNRGTQASDMTSLALLAFSTTDAALSISAGALHTCALFDAGAGAGRCRCWGNGADGQLGSGSTSNMGDNPTELSSVGFIAFSDTVPAVAVTAGRYHTCAAFANDRTRCWGNGHLGALGTDSTASVGNAPGDMISLGYIPLLPSVLYAVEPTSGSMLGSDTITITGIRFTSPTVTVQFTASTAGGCPSTPVSLTGVAPVSNTSIVIQTPSLASCGPSVANLVVISPLFNLTSLPSEFYFFSPSFAVTSFAASSPTGGPVLGGTVVTFLGTDLFATPNALCKFGSVTSPLTVINATTGSCTSPKVNISQDAPFRIALNGVTFTSTGPTFFYYDVIALSLDVSRGPASGSTPIYLRMTSTGSISHPGNVAIVRFVSSVNGAVATTVPGTVVADTNAPSGFSVLTLSPDSTPYSFLYPTTFTLIVSLNGGQQLLPPQAVFEYYNDPAVSGLSLTGVPADNAAGVVVTILGTNFRNYPLNSCKITMMGAVVTVPTTFNSFGGGVLVVTLPSLGGASVAGPAVFEISLNDGWQYTSNGKSLTLFVVSGVAPAGGPLAGGTALTVAGAGRRTPRHRA